jgi:integrase
VEAWRQASRHGLGIRAHSVPRAAARKKAKAAARKIDDGIDPIDERKKRHAPVLNFGEAAAECHATLSLGWTNKKHVAHWLPFIEKHAKPLYRKPVDKIDTDDVVRRLSPFWKEQPHLAHRLRERVQRVLNRAEAKGMRTGKKPASWRGNLQDWMAKPAPKHTRIEHMPSLHYNKIPDFMARLRATDTGVGARALEFTILTAARTGETFGATWDEFFLDGEWTGLWSIPAARMKMRRKHVVPLSDRALQIVKDQYETRRSRLVFPGLRDGRQLSTAAMLNVVQRLASRPRCMAFVLTSGIGPAISWARDFPVR